MSLLKAIKAQLGLSNTPANNFTITAEADNGTLKLARGNAGATTQDILTVDAAGNINAPVSIQKAGSVLQALSDFSGSNVSLTTNGYQKLPSGLIIQWGVSPPIAGGSSQTITFPVAFPAGCVSAIASLESSANSSTPCNANVNRLSATQLAIRNFGVTQLQASWVALGF